MGEVKARIAPEGWRAYNMELRYKEGSTEGIITLHVLVLVKRCCLKAEP